MNATTLFLSQIMGPVLLLMGVSFGLNKSYYVSWFKKMEKDDSFLFLAGIVELSAGLAVVLSHNLWNSAAEIIVSLMGWGMILEGAIVLLLNRKYPRGIVGHMSKSLPEFMSIVAIASLILGAYLSYLGYMM